MLMLVGSNRQIEKNVTELCILESGVDYLVQDHINTFKATPTLVAYFK